MLTTAKGKVFGPEFIRRLPERLCEGAFFQALRDFWAQEGLALLLEPGRFCKIYVEETVGAEDG